MSAWPAPLAGPWALGNLGKQRPCSVKVNQLSGELDWVQPLQPVTECLLGTRVADKVERDSELNKTWPWLSENLQHGWGSHCSTREPTRPREGFCCLAFKARAARYASPSDLLPPPISPPHPSASPWSVLTFIQEPSLRGAPGGRVPSRF